MVVTPEESELKAIVFSLFMAVIPTPSKHYICSQERINIIALGKELFLSQAMGSGEHILSPQTPKPEPQPCRAALAPG